MHVVSSAPEQSPCFRVDYAKTFSHNNKLVLRKPVIVKVARAAMINTSKKKEIRKITVIIAYNVHKYRCKQ